MRENRKKEQKQALPSGGLQAWMGGFVDMAIKVLSDRKEESLAGKDDLAAFLRTTPEALEAKSLSRGSDQRLGRFLRRSAKCKADGSRNGPGSSGGFRRTDSKNCNGAGFLDPGLPL